MPSEIEAAFSCRLSTIPFLSPDPHRAAQIPCFFFRFLFLFDIITFVVYIRLSIPLMNPSSEMSFDVEG